MSETPETQSTRKESWARKYGIDRLMQGLGFMIFWVALLFVSAGTVHWVRGWICAISYAGTMIMVVVVVWRLNPALFPARAKWRNRDTKRFDKIILPIYFPLTIIQPAIAGLDAVRYRWSSMALWTLYAGLGLLLGGSGLIAWTTAVNPWAETTVRIQTDRGQRVVRGGPYGIVRHPMYAGLILMYFSVGLMLGSVWAVVVGGAMAALLMVRTGFEDRTLQRELPGYREFTGVTRWRLLPGIW